MLFRRQTLEGIARGEIDRAFRRWKRAGAKSGSRVRTAAGVVRLGEVTVVDPARLTQADAAQAGFETLQDLHAMLGPDDGNPVYCIGVIGIEADERVALRDEAAVSPQEWDRLAARFVRWQSDKPGYFPGILKAIEAGPGVPAAKLAAQAGAEKLTFKQDVRKLKELGLTESLEIGYRLSSRGRAVIEKLGELGL